MKRKTKLAILIYFVFDYFSTSAYGESHIYIPIILLPLETMTIRKLCIFTTAYSW